MPYRRFPGDKLQPSPTDLQSEQPPPTRIVPPPQVPLSPAKATREPEQEPEHKPHKPKKHVKHEKKHKHHR